MSRTPYRLQEGGRRPGRWVLLSYRVPREPSTPRIAIWRKLDRLGVARLGDGLVALPADARTREHFDWLAQDILDAGGTASIWLAEPASRTQEQAIATQMAADRAAEYRAVIAAAEAASTETEAVRVRALRRLRAELRRIRRRDHFPPEERDQARRAVQTLAEATGPPAETTTSRDETDRNQGKEEERL